MIGLPDRERGERVCAVVETADGRRSRLDLRRDGGLPARRRAHAQKIPEQLEVVDALPRNDTLGKILKFELRDQFAEVPWSPAPRS